MKTADRLGVLLSGFSAEDRIQLRSVQWAAEVGSPVVTVEWCEVCHDIAERKPAESGGS